MGGESFLLPYLGRRPVKYPLKLDKLHIVLLAKTRYTQRRVLWVIIGHRGTDAPLSFLKPSWNPFSKALKQRGQVSLTAPNSSAVSVCVNVRVCLRWRPKQSHRVSEEAGGRGGVQLAPSNENRRCWSSLAAPPPSPRAQRSVCISTPTQTHRQNKPPLTILHTTTRVSPLPLMTVSRSIFTLSVVGWMRNISVAKLNGRKTAENNVPFVWSSLQ